MARIMKIRVIPRGYTPLDDKQLMHDIREMAKSHSPADFFMCLYTKYGNPMAGEPFAYMLRHNNVVIRIWSKDKETMEFKVWVSPGHVLDARRKRTKVMNIIARRLNEQGIVFVPDGDDNLYWAVRTKNAELMARQKGMSLKAVKEKMNDALDDKERTALYGGMAQYIPEVKEEIRNIFGYLFDGEPE